MNTIKGTKKSKTLASEQAEWSGFFVNRYWLLIYELDFVSKQLRYLQEHEPNIEKENASRRRKKQLGSIEKKKDQLIKEVQQAFKQLLKTKSKCGSSVLLPYEGVDQIKKILERVTTESISSTSGAWPIKSRYTEWIGPISNENSCPAGHGYIIPDRYSIANFVPAEGEENPPEESNAEWNIALPNHGLATFDADLFNPSRDEVLYRGTASFVYWRLPKPKCDGTLTLYINVSHWISFYSVAQEGGCSSYVSCCVSDSNGMLHPSPYLEVVQPWASESPFESGMKRLIIKKFVKKDAKVLVGLAHILFLAALDGWVSVSGWVATSHPAGDWLASPQLQYNFKPAEPPM